MTTEAAADLVVGIDVGGTKIAAALVDRAAGRVRRALRRPTPVADGGAAVLVACVALARELAPGGAAVGIGLCELVDPAGHATDAHTVDWRGLDIAAAFAGVGPVRVDSDVRTGACAEARLGAGRPYRQLVYVTVGTGISHCLVLDGEPFTGARGNAIVLGAPPVEERASGPALARAAGVPQAEQALADPAHDAVVQAAARELGLGLALLVNALDPEALVVGGGLGLNDRYRELAVTAARAEIFAAAARDLPILPAALGTDGPLLGAALVAP